MASRPATSSAPRWPASSDPPFRASFSDLALYAACPLKYRYLRVDEKEEPPTPPDWRKAPPEAPPEVPPEVVPTIASEVDRELGLAVHAALRRWQHRIDGGASAKPGDLVAVVRAEATRRGLESARLDRLLSSLEPGLSAYAAGPWPRRHTLFLEQPVRHTLRAAGGFELELHLRVDRVVRYQLHVAILDFKSFSPHAFELHVDQWQLRTYAMAAPELLGMPSSGVQLFLVDLRQDAEVPVASGEADLADARDELLVCASGIADRDYAVDRYPGRPCWSCGFRLECPASLATERAAAAD